MKLAISRLNKIVEFGKPHTTQTRTIEGSKTEFNVVKTLHCAIYQRTLAQQYQLIGTELANTIVIAVRSQAKVDDALQVRFKDDTQTYRIVNISRDESHNYPRYDLITLSKITKAG